MAIPILAISLPYALALCKQSPSGVVASFLRAAAHVCLALGTVWNFAEFRGWCGHAPWARRGFSLTILFFGYFVYNLFECTLSSYLTIRKLIRQ